MPLMRPEVQKVLRSAGLIAEKQAESDSPISEKLDAAGLSLENTFEGLSQIALSSGNEALRLRALETSLKAHGALKEIAPPIPSFTIIIQPSATGSSSSVAGIPVGVNPILLPRQLLKSLAESGSETGTESEGKGKPN